VEPEEYGRTAAAEDRHFWFRESRAIWAGLLRYAETARRHRGSGAEPEVSVVAAAGRRRLITLDAGCGTGGNLRALEEPAARGPAVPGESGPGHDRIAIGVDLSPIALDLARRRVRSPLVRGSILALPFREGSFDVALCADVLYHAEVRDDVTALRELRRVIRPGGVLCVNVPAFDALRSAHDRAMHTARRYTRDRLRERLVTAGFAAERIIYWNGLLLLPAILIRLLRKRGGSRSEIVDLPPMMNGILWGIARLDATLALRGLLPAGLSVAAVAKRENG
jgi:SAM-dependent methyltransferase